MTSVSEPHVMRQFCKDQGIVDGETELYSPQENGHAEHSIDMLKVRLEGQLADSGAV
jgi:hypothetical protein